METPRSGHATPSFPCTLTELPLPPGEGARPQHLSHSGGWQPRKRLADVDATGEVDIADAIKILEHLFLGGRLGGVE
jgi:hypothetical protein